MVVTCIVEIVSPHKGVHAAKGETAQKCNTVIHQEERQRDWMKRRTIEDVAFVDYGHTHMQLVGDELLGRQKLWWDRHTRIKTRSGESESQLGALLADDTIIFEPIQRCVDDWTVALNSLTSAVS